MFLIQLALVHNLRIFSYMTAERCILAATEFVAVFTLLCFSLFSTFSISCCCNVSMSDDKISEPWHSRSARNGNTLF